MRLGLGNGLSFPRPSTGGWVDPLAGIPFTLRLQTHRGDGVPFGLYQDTACTIRSMDEGDPIAAWRDEITGSGLAAIEENVMKQPVLRFRSGVPTVSGESTDSRLTLDLAVAGSFEWCMGVSITAPASNFRRILSIGNEGQEDYNNSSTVAALMYYTMPESLITFYNGSDYGNFAISYDQLFSSSAKYTGTAIEMTVNGAASTFAVANSINATKVRLLNSINDPLVEAVPGQATALMLSAGLNLTTLGTVRTYIDSLHVL